MFFREDISWIADTPIGIRIRNIEFVPTHMHENLVEIILCLQGSVKFCYGYEEFTLSEGEFITVDKDAHYLFDEYSDNICVSLYIDLEWFMEKYPYITSLLFVCEATKGARRPYPTYYHKQLKGIVIAILIYLIRHGSDENECKKAIVNGAERIVEILIQHFEIAYYYNPELVCKKELIERNHSVMVYLRKHAADKITLDYMAQDFNLAPTYLSEFLRTFNIGFRRTLSYIRANNSEKLLLASDMNITAISEACGFSDPKYYYAAFKEWYKCTPMQFRKIYRNKMYGKASEQELKKEDLLTILNDKMLDHFADLFLF